MQTDDLKTAHEGDSSVYLQLAMHAYDVAKICRELIGEESRLHERLHQAGRITAQQKGRLFDIMKGRDPRDDDSESVFKIPFPSPDHDPPHAA